jgi:hypothetical protein
MKTLGKKITNSLQILNDFVDGDVLVLDAEGNVVPSDIAGLLSGTQLEVAGLTINTFTEGNVPFVGADGVFEEDDNFY